MTAKEMQQYLESKDYIAEYPRINPNAKHGLYERCNIELNASIDSYKPIISRPGTYMTTDARRIIPSSY